LSIKLCVCHRFPTQNDRQGKIVRHQIRFSNLLYFRIARILDVIAQAVENSEVVKHLAIGQNIEREIAPQKKTSLQNQSGSKSIR
jgi:hypothetical protein